MYVGIEMVENFMFFFDVATNDGKVEYLNEVGNIKTSVVDYKLILFVCSYLIVKCLLIVNQLFLKNPKIGASFMNRFETNNLVGKFFL